MKKNRRDFLLLAADGLLFGTIVALPGGCSQEEAKEGAASRPMLPAGVHYDPPNKHTPRCVLEDAGEDWKLDVVVRHVVTKAHHIKGVTIAGPGPAFQQVAKHDYTDAYIAKADDPQWRHTFRFPKKSVPAGARHLVVWSHCNKHGDYGMTQGV